MSCTVNATGHITDIEGGCGQFTTVELKTNFLKPVWNEKLTARAEVMKKGQTIGLIKCDVFDESGKLVAYSTSTCMTLCGEKAKGREDNK